MRFFIGPTMCGLSLVLSACSESVTAAPPEAVALPEPEDPASTAVPESACGDTTLVDVTICGTLRDADGAPITGASARLEERSWMPGTVFGAGDSDDAGEVWFDAVAVPIVEGCWAVGPQFYLVVDAGGAVGEAPANATVVGAWLDGTLEADFSAFVIELVTDDTGGDDDDDGDGDED